MPIPFFAMCRMHASPIFPAPDDHHRLLRQIAPENLLGQLHRHASHRGRAAPDQRLRADGLDHLKGPLKCAIQHPPRQFRRQRRVVGRFDLPGNFRFPQHHRIQPAGHRKQMPRRRFSGVNINVRCDIHFGGGKRSQQFGLSAGLLRHPIQLHPVASAKQGDFRQAALFLQPRRRFDQPRRRHRQLLAQGHRGGLEADAGHEDHAGLLGALPPLSIRTVWFTGDFRSFNHFVLFMSPAASRMTLNHYYTVLAFYCTFFGKPKTQKPGMGQKMICNAQFLVNGPAGRF